MIGRTLLNIWNRRRQLHFPGVRVDRRRRGSRRRETGPVVVSSAFGCGPERFGSRSGRGEIGIGSSGREQPRPMRDEGRIARRCRRLVRDRRGSPFLRCARARSLIVLMDTPVTTIIVVIRFASIRRRRRADRRRRLDRAHRRPPLLLARTRTRRTTSPSCGEFVIERSTPHARGRVFWSGRPGRSTPERFVARPPRTGQRPHRGVLIRRDAARRTSPIRCHERPRTAASAERPRLLFRAPSVQAAESAAAPTVGASLALATGRANKARSETRRRQSQDRGVVLGGVGRMRVVARVRVTEIRDVDAVVPALCGGSRRAR